MSPEPWLRGPIPDVDPLVAPVLYAFQQAREDIAKYTDGIATDPLWTTPHGSGSIAFHIRHIAGSVDRLMTYLQGGQLTRAQLDALHDEEVAHGWPREELLGCLNRSLAAAESIVRAMDPATLTEPRAVGRQRMPTTVIGLLTHIAEHTQRHVGQTITTCQWIRASVAGPNSPQAFRRVQ
jgi:hypothetical protein